MSQHNQQSIRESQQNFNSQLELGKLPPQAIEIEEAVLGALLMDPDIHDEVLNLIQSHEVFYTDVHQRIYQAIQRLVKSKKTIDLLTVAEELGKSSELEIIGGPYTLAQLTHAVVSSAHVIVHCRILIEKYTIRNVIKTAGAILQQAYQNDVDAFELVQYAEKEVMQLSLNQVGNELTHISEPTKEFKKETEFKLANDIKSTGIMSGMEHLDRITNGWQDTDLIILAARPSVGKTAFALNLAKNAAKQKKITAVFSLEMGIGQLVTRLVSMTSSVELAKLKDTSKMVEKDVLNVFNLGIPEIESSPIYFDETAGITVTDLRSKCRRLKSKKGLDLIIIDYLQLMKGGTRYRGNREQEISEISRELKPLAKELKVPVIALSQLSRAMEGRAEKRPMLSDLRESGAIEQDADMVMFLYRPLENDVKNNPQLKHATLLDIAKHRNGELDSMPLYRDLSIQRFYNSYSELPQKEVINDDFIDNKTLHNYHNKSESHSLDDLPF